MCGIAGFVQREGAAPPEELHRMLSAIVHRGPDALGGYVDGGAAIGCARLSITDIAGGTQPAISDDGQVSIVFNGEIFNYAALRAGLVAGGVRFRTNSEVETLLQLYLERGPELFALLNGQFAIAIWDARTQRLILARDRVGIRPLFWTRTADRFVFGSEVKALAALPDVTLRLDRQALLQSFRFWTVVGDTSAFEGVHQLPPAHYAVVTAADVTLVRYWQWPMPGEVAPLRLSSDAEYFEAFVHELRASVRRQKMADVTVGSYLSGGIDSSAVAAFLQAELSAPLRTYSVAFDDPEYDESQAQRLMAARGGFDHKSLVIRAGDIADAFPSVVYHAETPLFRSAPTPLFLLSGLVHRDGIKVVMTGEGADEVLLGYDLFREVSIRRFWSHQPDSQWRGALLGRLYAYLPQYRDPRFLRLLLDFYRSTLADTGDPHYAMAPRWGNGRALEVYLSDEMRAAAAGGDGPVRALERWLPAGYGHADDVSRAQAVEMTTLLANYLLSSQGDRMSMSHAVEGRYPYLDHEFLDFAARLPSRLKLRGLKDKFILRQAVAAAVPAEIRQRPKVAYQAPDVKGFVEGGRVPDYVAELFAPERIRQAGLFAPERVQQLLAKARSSTLARIGTRDNMAFVLVLSTMLLEEMFVSGRRRVASTLAIQRPLLLRRPVHDTGAVA
ncbi:MAG: asparagine synthase (glutamine-hydrolyzing) [Vicinamibacterales bacterium]